MTGMVLLLAGPAGAGKSTLARAWCGTRRVAAHVEVDVVRALVIKGLVDPQAVGSPGQSEQWRAAVEATCALARSFAGRGVDVAIDDLVTPSDAADTWTLLLQGVETRLVVVLPTLEVVLDRGRRRAKDVPEQLVADQYRVSSMWPRDRLLDTTELDVNESLEHLLDLLANQKSRLSQTP